MTQGYESLDGSVGDAYSGNARSGPVGGQRTENGISLPVTASHGLRLLASGTRDLAARAYETAKSHPRYALGAVAVGSLLLLNAC